MSFIEYLFFATESTQKCFQWTIFSCRRVHYCSRSLQKLCFMTLNVPLNPSRETPHGWMVTRGATSRRCWCCELCPRILQRAHSSFRTFDGECGWTISRCTSSSSVATNVSVFEECGQLVQLIDGCWLRLIKKFERLHYFIVGFVLRLQPNLVHLDDLIEKEITRNRAFIYCLMKSDEVSQHQTEYGSGFTAIHKKRPLAPWCVARWSGTRLPVAPINCRTC